MSRSLSLSKLENNEEKGHIKVHVEKHWTLNKLLRPLHTVRYLIIRTICVPIPFWSHRIPIIGGKTAIEMAIMIFIAVMAISSAGSGKYSDIMSAMIVVLSMRFNLLTAIFGIPFERALFWHKLVALVAMGCIGVHMKKEGKNNSGIALIILMSIACGSYLIKPFIFELFHLTHIVCYVMTIPYALKHGCKFFPYAVVAWALDLLLRYIVTQRVIKMDAEALAGDVVRLSFKKCFEYEPGQYCFLLIPTINYVEYHPFSISSCANEDVTTIHIRALGNWSRRLYEKTKILQAENHGKAISMNVCCEGPFGSPAIDHESHNYKVWLLVSGGIGITPLQSMYNHFIYQEQAGKRQFRKVIFIWSVKDKATAEIMEADRSKARYLPLSFQPPMEPSPTLRSQVQRDSSSCVLSDEDGHEMMQIKNTVQSEADIEQQQQRPRDSANDDGMELQTPNIFHAEYYLTQIRSSEEFASAGIDPVEQRHVHFGRPSISKLFERTRLFCETESIHRVGVMVCGPKSMHDEVMDLCQRSQLDPKCNAIRFDGHSELFDF